MKKLFVHIILFLFAASAATAQDLHFSQFYNSPLTTNPANTGFIPDADYRLGVNYRQQWSNIMFVPYQTMSAFADFQLMRNKLENGWLGVGAMFLNDVAGSGSLRSTKVYGSVAYHQMLGLDLLVSGGFNIGYASKSIQPGKLKFPDQFDGKFFDITLPTSVVLNQTNISYLDVQAGMNFAYFPTENTYINLGYSIHHVNQPRESFFNNTNDKDAKVPMRHIGFVNGIFRVADRVIVSPNVYYTNTSRASELVGGAIASYNLSPAGDKQFNLGAYYRLGDAAIGVAGFNVGNLKFTFSYDATVSGLKSFNKSRGAYELSIIKNGFYPDNVDRASLCPKF